MLDITFTINGRQVSPANLGDHLERAVIDGLKKMVQEKFRNVGTTANGERLKVELKGTRADNLTIHLSGPNELVEKAKKLLS